MHHKPLKYCIQDAVYDIEYKSQNARFGLFLDEKNVSMKTNEKSEILKWIFHKRKRRRESQIPIRM